MSIQIMTLVWKYSKLKGSELLLLLAIADNANSESKLAWPSLEYLANKTRLSRRQVIRLISIIEQKGELEVIRSGSNTRRSNRYRIIIDSDKLSLSDSTDSDISEGISDTQGTTSDIAMSQTSDIAMSQTSDIAMSHEPLLTNKEPSLINHLITTNKNEILGLKEFEAIREYLKIGMGKKEFSSYLGDSSFVELQGGTLFIGVDSEEKIDWLNSRTKKKIENFIPGFRGIVSKVEYILI